MLVARNLFSISLLLILFGSVFAAEKYDLEKQEAILVRTPSRTPPPLSPMSPPPARSPMSSSPNNKASYSPGEAQLRLELAAAMSELAAKDQISIDAKRRYCEAELDKTRARLRMASIMNALQQKKYATSLHPNESRDAAVPVNRRLLYIPPASSTPIIDLGGDQVAATLSPSPNTRHNFIVEALINQNPRKKAIDTLLN